MTTPTQNGTPPPVANGTTQTQQPAPAVENTSGLSDLKAKLAEAETREVTLKRELVVGKRQWDREKQTFGEKLKDADAYARLKKTASVDKLSAARELLGDDFLESLNQQAANGGTPSAASLQHALERVREETLAEVDARTKKQQAEQQERETQAETQARTSLSDETTYFYGEAMKEYPLLEALGDQKRVGEVLASNISGPQFMRFRQAIAAGDADARVKLYREVAEKLENTLAGIAEKAAGHEKYQPKLRDKLTPVKVAGTVTPSSQSLPQSQQDKSPQGRRSLTNDIATGSTPPNEPPPLLTKEQELERAKATYARALAAKAGR